MKHLGVVGLVLAVGCGGGAPVGDDVRVNEISASEARELCEYWTDQLGPPRTLTCSGGEPQEVGAEPGEALECAEEVQGLADAVSADCGLTVGDLDDCIQAQVEATDAQICSGEDPQACVRLEAIFESCDPGGDDVPTDPPGDSAQ